MLYQLTPKHRKFALDCVFRMGEADDIAKLEWFGAFAEHREIIAGAFAAQASGEGLVVVATVKGFPVAQVWARLYGPRQPPRFWAFRVMEPLQGAGLGSYLLEFGEQLLFKREYSLCEIGVERNNPAARAFYHQRGYELGYRETEQYSYITPDGERRACTADQWILRKQLSGRVRRQIG
jgi:GNAT superfamily N-acetyltransferase